MPAANTIATTMCMYSFIPFRRALLLCALLSLPLVCLAEDAGKLKSDIAQEQQEVQKKKSEIKRLSKEEGALHGDVAKVEKRIDSLEGKLGALQKELRDMSRSEASLEKEREKTGRAVEQARKELAPLASAIWPAYIGGLQGMLSSLSSWPEADRRYHWLREIYAATEKSMAELEQRSREMEATLEKQVRARKDVQAQLARIEEAKKELLADKILYQRRMREIRAQKVAGEQEVNDILSAIEQLQFQLKALSGTSFKAGRGNLPWPASGGVAAGFSPKADPPMRGIGISAPAGSPVRAVSTGKVVHNDTLRGFGKVLILSHGDNFYTLYAFLAEAPPTVGRTIKAGEPLGTVGFYPKLNTTGLYFEIRAGTEAQNPMTWLAKK